MAGLARDADFGLIAGWVWFGLMAVLECSVIRKRTVYREGGVDAVPGLSVRDLARGRCLPVVRAEVLRRLCELPASKSRDRALCGACGERLDQAQPVGERKVVTVLFADIVGSTELIGDKDPELALDRLPPALEAHG